MTRTLKKPTLTLNKKYKTTMNIKAFKANIDSSNIKKLRNEFSCFYSEVELLKNSLLDIKNNYGHSDFIKYKEQETLQKKENAYEETYTNVPTTQALTVVKKRLYFKSDNYNKKSGKIFVKIITNYINNIFFKFIYIKNMIYLK